MATWPKSAAAQTGLIANNGWRHAPPRADQKARPSQQTTYSINRPGDRLGPFPFRLKTIAPARMMELTQPRDEAEVSGWVALHSPYLEITLRL